MVWERGGGVYALLGGKGHVGGEGEGGDLGAVLVGERHEVVPHLLAQLARGHQHHSAHATLIVGQLHTKQRLE